MRGDIGRLVEETLGRRQAAVLVIVPPFGMIDRPALGPHLLQACARQAGHEIAVLYANILLAAEIGEAAYRSICKSPLRAMLGERIFARAAYGVPALGRDRAASGRLRLGRNDRLGLRLNDLLELEQGIGPWLDELVDTVLGLDVKILGCSTTFEQTAASVALLARAKQRRPGIITLLGGANCEGDMAEGLCSLGAEIDYIFSGEGERTFPPFLQALLSGVRPSNRIVLGEPWREMDQLPTPDFSDYYRQREAFLPNGAAPGGRPLWLPYESSRGCWWGQKHHCTFCGLNGTTMTFRSKSAERVVRELESLLQRHPSRFVFMADNIMPNGYFHSLLPRLEQELPELHVFYEQKANLTLPRLLALERAGVTEIQAGIEALSTSLLKRMDKGVSAPQVIALLRFARSVGVSVIWNLLHAFPGDRLAEYEETLALLPLIRHLQPPSGFRPLVVDKFSPYHTAPVRYGLRDVRPWPAYHSILPAGADVARIAYHFDADYPSESRAHPELMAAIDREVRSWRGAWRKRRAVPVLEVIPINDEQFLLLDTRGLPGARRIRFLTRSQASVVLAGRRARDEDVRWALDGRLAVELDSIIVPLATADAALLSELDPRKVRQPAGKDDYGLLSVAYSG